MSFHENENERPLSRQERERGTFIAARKHDKLSPTSARPSLLFARHKNPLTMAFNFGAPPGPAAAPGAGNNNGNTASTTPAAPGTSGSTGFSFGGGTNAPATTPASTGTAAPSTNAPAPAASGFSFGGTPAPATTTPPTAAPATGAFGFGGGNNAQSNAAPTPAAPSSSFSFAHAPSAASSPAAPTPAASATSPAITPAVTVPEYTSIFPNMTIIEKLDTLLPQASLSQDSDDARLAAQELQHVLNCTVPASQDVTQVFGSYLAKPTVLEWKQPDLQLRERLRQNPHVSLHGQTAALTPSMLQEVFQLSDELHIAESDALALYAEASKRETRTRLQDRLEYSFVDNSMTGSIDPLVLGDDVFRASRELYFYERNFAIKAILELAQYRLALDPSVLQATDQLLVANLIDNLVTYIREWTARTDALEQEFANATRPAQNMFGLQPPPVDPKNETNFAKVHLKFGYNQRQTAAESLFYLTYNTQCTPQEVASLIDLIRDLTNGTSDTTGLPLLNPFQDVPSAYVVPTPGVANNQFPLMQPLPPLREKDAVEWHHELVDQVWKMGGKPQLLQCVSILALAGITSLDSRHELIDRNTHTVNSFGVVSLLLRVLY